MKIIRAKDYQDMSRKAAHFIAAQVILKEDSVLGFATGSTVLGIYEHLTNWYSHDDLDFSRISSVNLDEYVGMSGTDSNSYRYFMKSKLFDYINIPIENTHLPDGMAEDMEAECCRYNALIERLGGIDLQLLGLGHNGHIGFNEPDGAFHKLTHCMTLNERTRIANARFFGSKEAVPRQAITMGIKNIMLSKRILLCVSDKSKAEVLMHVLSGAVAPEIPGSILQMHPQLTVIADEEALSKMSDHCLLF